VKNFYTIEFKRINENIKDVFIFHLDGNFVHHEIKDVDENDVSGYASLRVPFNSKVKRFNDLFAHATNIYEEVEVSIVRNKDGIWGILHNDGRIFNNENLVEPIIDDSGCEIVGFANSGLAPFYDVDGDVAFINKYSEIVAVLNLDRINNKAKLFDKNKSILKEWEFEQIYVPNECFFFGGNLIKLFEQEDFTGLLNEFLEEESDEYVFPSDIFGPSIGDEFNIDYENTEEGDIHYGNIYIVGYAYYTSDECERYDFLYNYINEVFEEGYFYFKKKLSNLLGDATISGDDYSVWRMNKSYIILDVFDDHDQGDFGCQIRLYSYDEIEKIEG